MKKIIYTTLAFTIVAAISCTKNTNLSVQKGLLPGQPWDTTLQYEVSVNTTLTKNTYLQGLVYVRPGITLTINPGVTIYGSPGTSIPDYINIANNKGTLLVQRAAKLIANGTPSAPIVWTSSQPPGSRSNGDWGGIVLYGGAPIHANTNVTGSSGSNVLMFTDGSNSDIPYAWNTYGSNLSNDNSGSVTYNRFEFGGGIIRDISHQLDAVTMCGVGSGTVFNHNEVAWSGGAGLKCYGGTVNADHLFIYETANNNLDFDEGYTGHLQFILGYQQLNSGWKGTHFIRCKFFTNTPAETSPFIANATYFGPLRAKNYNADPQHYFDGAISLSDYSRLTLVNSLIISQQHPYLLVLSPFNQPLVAHSPSLTDSVVLARNIFQTNSAKPVVNSSNTSDNTPVSLGAPNEVNLINILANAANANSSLPAYTDFKLGFYLENMPSSPSLTGGIDLHALGLIQFTGTTERGAVLSTDVWTKGAWISVANN